jgi:hypothetical protein
MWNSQCKYCHDFSVTVSRNWNDYWIYWTLWYSAWLRFRIHCYIHRVVSTVTSSLPLFGSGFQRRTFPFLRVPELSPASATSFSQQQLTATEPQRLSNSLTHQTNSTQSLTNRLTPLHWLTDWTHSSLTALFIISRHGPHRKYRSSVAAYGPFLSNGRYLVVCFAVVA